MFSLTGRYREFRAVFVPIIKIITNPKTDFHCFFAFVPVDFCNDIGGLARGGDDEDPLISSQVGRRRQL